MTRSSAVKKRRMTIVALVKEHALHQKEGAFFGDKYLAEKLECSLSTIEKDLRWLRKEGYIQCKTSSGMLNTNPKFGNIQFYRNRTMTPSVPKKEQPLPEGAIRTAEGVILERGWSVSPYNITPVPPGIENSSAEDPQVEYARHFAELLEEACLAKEVRIAKAVLEEERRRYDREADAAYEAMGVPQRKLTLDLVFDYAAHQEFSKEWMNVDESPEDQVRSQEHSP